MNYPTTLTLLACAAVAAFIVYRSCIHGRRKLRLSDLFYLGHVFVLTVLLFVAGTVGYLTIARRQPLSSFNRQLWNADPERRVEIVDDLIHSHLLDSKPADDIKALLGTPLRVFKDSLGYRLGYYLGTRKGPFYTDPEFLIVDIRNEKVGHYYLKPGVPYVN